MIAPGSDTNYFAIGAALALVIVGTVALLGHARGRQQRMSKATASVLLVVGLALGLFAYGYI